MSARRGFSLTEVAVAILVITIVSMAVLTAILAASGITSRAEARFRVTGEAANVGELLNASDLVGAMDALYGDSWGRSANGAYTVYFDAHGLPLTWTDTASPDAAYALRALVRENAVGQRWPADQSDIVFRVWCEAVPEEYTLFVEGDTVVGFEAGENAAYQSPPASNAPLDACLDGIRQAYADLDPISEQLVHGTALRDGAESPCVFFTIRRYSRTDLYTITLENSVVDAFEASEEATYPAAEAEEAVPKDALSLSQFCRAVLAAYPGQEGLDYICELSAYDTACACARRAEITVTRLDTGEVLWTGSSSAVGQAVIADGQEAKRGI